MTGYGQAAGENGSYRVTVSVRTVNHRFLDLVLRLPEAHRERESRLRDRCSAHLSRGRVELRLAIDTLAAAGLGVEVRADVARQILEAVDGLVQQGLVRGGLDLGDLLRMPEVLAVTPAPLDWSPADELLLDEVVDQAVTQVVAAREREGARLASVLDDRLGELGGLVERIDGLRSEVQKEQARRFKERLAELMDGAASQPDEGRLAQEVAVLAERSDVQEEIDRLGAHLSHFREIAGSEGPHGKRLDFLSQEILRELNTLGAKCRDGEIVRLVLEAKSVCEQIREQVQNLE